MNTTRDIPYISQERGYAVFRRRIPTRLRSAFGGQQEIFASLRHAPLETMTEGSTRRRAGYRKAVKRAAALLGAEVEKALSRAESGEFVGRMESRRCEEILAHALTREDAPAVVEPSLPPPPPPLLESDIEPLARRYQSLHLLTDHTMRFGDDDSTVPMLLEEHRAYKDLIEETVEQLSEAQACGDTGIVREVAQEFLASEGFAAQVADNVYRKFEQRLLAADLETAQLQLLRAQGQTVSIIGEVRPGTNGVVLDG